MDYRTSPRPRPVESGSQKLIGLAWQRLAGVLGVGKSPEERVQELADRSHRLRALLAGEPVEDVWALDLQPIFEEVFDSALAQVMNKDLHADALVALLKLYSQIDRAAGLGQSVLRRMARSNVERLAADQAEKSRQGTA